MKNFNEKTNFIRLSELTSKIEKVISGEFEDLRFWVVAEISSINVRKGHCYLNLVEKKEGSVYPITEIKALIWRSTFVIIAQKFKEYTGRDLSNNMEILLLTQVKFSGKFGFNLHISDIEPKYTLGQMLIEREKTIKRLKDKGYYYLNKKKEIPLVPQRVAVISAKDSRGFEDFKNKLENNKYNYNFEITLFPAMLQGDRAAEDIRNKLIKIFRELHNFDIVAIVRGGGNETFLNCFNDFRLAEAVARFPKPIISGIGHSANVSVVDQVANKHKITPSEVAEFLVDRVKIFDENIKNYFKNIVNIFKNKTKEKYFDIDRKKQLISSATYRQIKELLKENQSSKKKLEKLIQSLIEKKLKDNIEDKNRMQKSILKMVKNQEQEIEKQKIKIELLNPLNILKRGYSITTYNGKLLKNCSNLGEKDLIKTKIFNAEIESKIEKIWKKKK